ncbi:MAG TPA: hypothetical protein VMW56_24755 [Candidatus Margulisiibacteriota bacterium]|nr:hypothetical protein [Candidatus Margulisiibacteriota bacterium]
MQLFAASTPHTCPEGQSPPQLPAVSTPHGVGLQPHSGTRAGIDPQVSPLGQAPAQAPLRSPQGFGWQTQVFAAALCTQTSSGLGHPPPHWGADFSHASGTDWQEHCPVLSKRHFWVASVQSPPQVGGEVVLTNPHGEPSGPQAHTFLPLLVVVG